MGNFIFTIYMLRIALNLDSLLLLASRVSSLHLKWPRGEKLARLYIIHVHPSTPLPFVTVCVVESERVMLSGKHDVLSVFPVLQAIMRNQVEPCG